jgi:integrase/recombinase XerD
MQSIIDLKLLERLRVGPLAQYFDPYLARIEEEGFLPSSVPCQAYAITRFSKWLEQKRIPLRDVDGTIVRTFLNRDAGIVHYPERATIHRLVAILRDIEVLKAEPTSPLTAEEECVSEYRQYLELQRGLSVACLPNYLSYVVQFLQEKFAERELRFDVLRAPDVTTYMKSHVSKLSAGRAKLLVTALRSFLRYLLHQGKITVGPFPLRFASGLLVVFRDTKVSSTWSRGTSACEVQSQGFNRAAELRDSVAAGPFRLARWRGCHSKSGRSGLG